MTRARNLGSKPPTDRVEDAKKLLPPIYAYAVEGDPVKVLADMKLPEGASVAIITRRPAADSKIKRLKAMRLYRDQLAGSGEASRNDVIDNSAFKPDARSRALLRGVKLAEEDLRAAGGAYDLAEVSTLMRGISRQAINKRVRERTLLAVPGPNHRRSYPTLQFNADGSVVDGLKPVLDALPTKNPWAVLNFLINADARLGGAKPIDLLRAGKVESVVEAARRIGTQGA